MHYTTATSSKHNDYRTAKQGLYDQDVSRSFSPQYNSSQDDIYKSSSLYTTKREEVNCVLILIALLLAFYNVCQLRVHKKHFNSIYACINAII